jgi:hypothetical protein
LITRARLDLHAASRGSVAHDALMRTPRRIASGPATRRWRHTATPAAAAATRDMRRATLGFGDNRSHFEFSCYDASMSDEFAATSPDAPRPAATGGDNEFTLTIEEVAERYARAGHPRTIRTLQRYCAIGHLDAQKVATTLGDKYLITPQSVRRHIAQIEELRALDTVAADRDQPRPVATAMPPNEIVQIAELPSATDNDTSRQAATPGDIEPKTATTDSGLSHYVERLEREVEIAKDERDFYREQIDRKDKTIDSLLERDRETNILVRGLQEMLSPLLGPARRERPQDHQGNLL